MLQDLHCQVFDIDPHSKRKSVHEFFVRQFHGVMRIGDTASVLNVRIKFLMCVIICFTDDFLLLFVLYYRFCVIVIIFVNFNTTPSSLKLSKNYILGTTKLINTYTNYYIY